METQPTTIPAGVEERAAWLADAGGLEARRILDRLLAEQDGRIVLAGQVR